MNREQAHEFVQGLLDFGRVMASTVGSAARSVLVTIRGIEDDETPVGEERTAQELWGSMAVLVRPAAPTDDGTPEVVFARLGDEMVAIASRDLRWQVELDEGEVVVRGLGENAARIHLHADGTVDVIADRINLVNDDPGDAVALASKTNDKINAIQRALDALAAAIPAANDGGAAIQTAFKGVWGTGAPPTADASVGSEKVKVE